MYIYIYNNEGMTMFATFLYVPYDYHWLYRNVWCPSAPLTPESLAWEQDVEAEGCDLYVRLTSDHCIQPWSKGENIFEPKKSSTDLFREPNDWTE